MNIKYGLLEQNIYSKISYKISEKTEFTYTWHLTVCVQSAKNKVVWENRCLAFFFWQKNQKVHLVIEVL